MLKHSRPGDALTLLLAGLLLELVLPVLLPWGQDDGRQEGAPGVRLGTAQVFLSPTPPSTLEEVDPLSAAEAVGREGKGCIHIIWDAIKAFSDVARIVRVQDSILEAPVLTTLCDRQVKGHEEGTAWAQPFAAGLLPRTYSLP